MSKLLRRPTRQQCFFCNSDVLPKDPRSFRCPQCACWNRYDTNGEIMSDDPAMHDESLNTRSFARRASPRKDRLPASYGTTVFCHTCQTNQMLISNLLANYLPTPDDPEYSRLYQQLPVYRADLEKRYPPICVNCLPAVEEEIKRRDNMARTNALGVLLKNSKGKGKERQRQNSGSSAQLQRTTLEKDLVLWRIRGVLWVSTLALVLSSYTCALAGYAPLRLSSILTASAPLLALVSIIWTAWDPRYATFRRSRLQGREVRLRRKREYNILQSIAWLSRLITSMLWSISTFKPSWTQFYNIDTSVPYLSLSLRRSQWYFAFALLLELSLLLRSAVILRIDRPPAVRLMPQFSHRPSLPSSDFSSPPTSRYATPAVDAPDLLSTLTLANGPILSRHSTASPVFGVPAFSQPAPANGHANGHVNGYANGYADGHGELSDAMEEDTQVFGSGDGDALMDDDDEREHDPDAMDWSPIQPARRPPSHLRQHSSGDVLLRPQRFFPREEPTGLEGLFEKTIKLSDEDAARMENKGLLGWVKDRWRKEA